MAMDYNEMGEKMKKNFKQDLKAADSKSKALKKK
jgi:hypothetical protein